MRDLSGLRKFRILWVTIPLVTLAYFFFGSFNPLIAAVGETEVRASRAHEPSLFARTKTTIAVRQKKNSRELGRETPAETESSETSKIGLSTLGSTFGFAKSSEADVELPKHAPEEDSNFLERMYEERPYANGSPHFDRRMRYDYEFDSPFRHETRQDFDRIRDVRKDQFRGWSKSAMRDQAKNIVSDADQDSAPISTLRLFKGVFGGGDLFHKDEEESRAKKPRRRNDGTVSSEEYSRSAREVEVNRVYLDSHDRSEKEDEDIETKLRSRLNVARRSGKLEFENPVVTTGAQVDFRARDRVEVKASRQLKALALDTSVSYGPRYKTVAMNVEKRITEELSCELRSTKSNHRDIHRDQSVRLNYKVDF